jgi:hypothetical protein
VLGRGSYVKTVFPAFFRSAADACSLWSVVSGDFRETVRLNFKPKITISRQLQLSLITITQNC